ncbi:peptide/nickel transport system permease protein [Modestobacter sp. DSM 44400]|uniref:ABC transporter permease n=1 Tax=Modestobacter sp. DSM 44400 TaxID=1550230 RepID=UPI0008943B57|nr:ABC transporter permease [Modestobacter sp. DSM 44400]SDY27568.1 peptide/nickel transport system permease protein [Modestobacter sp. DSM 44400]
MSTASLTGAVVRPRPRRSGSTARIATAVVMTVVLLAYAALLVHPGLFTSTSPLFNGPEALVGPSAQHLFGTDQLGRDVYSRVIYGSQSVLAASLGGVLLASVAGVAIGIIGGTAPRVLSVVVMRVVDVLLALPVLLVALILIATLGAGVNSIILALGVAYTPGFARVVEASVRKLRSVEFMQAARLFGSSGARTAVRHLLPNLATEVVVMASSAVGWAVLTATTLSFLGLGVQLPEPDWGSDLAAGATSLSTAWWLSTFPGLAITVTILVANYSGDWVMTLTDPRGRQTRSRFRALGGLSTTLPAANAVAPGQPASLTSESFTGADAGATGQLPASAPPDTPGTATTPEEQA